MDIKKIDSVSIRVRDLARAQKFYADTLGLPEIWRMDEQRSVGYGVGDNSATINIEQRPERAKEMAVVVQVEDVDVERRGLEKKGVRFRGETFTIPEIGKGAYFEDPDGNEWMLLDYSIEHAREAAGR